MPRVIPSTFASQHPDHASTPYWHDQPFISTQLETQETIRAFQELGVEEYKWDWEGKLVDESVIERLFATEFDYFQQNQLGRDRFLTFRLPNPYEETEVRVGRAFMGILSAAALAKKVGFHTPPLFEVILPMTESAKSLIDIQEAFREMAGLKHWMFNMQHSQLQHIQMIPLFEQVDVIINSAQILAEYLKTHEEKFGYKPQYIRPYVARSDPSMNSGHVATVLAIKIAFSRYQQLAAQTGVEMYPMIGCAKLLFRGGLAPDRIEDFVDEYSGVKTVLIQSAFRYDYPREVAQQGIIRLKELLPQSQPRHLTVQQEKQAIHLIRVFERYYRQAIEGAAKTVNAIASHFPRRRERVQHIGLFGYSRGVGGVSLPRAIKTTGSLYSIGIPPEIFGTGRALREVMREGTTDDLRVLYRNIIEDYRRTGGFLNKQNLARLAEQDGFWKTIQQDVAGIEEFLGEELQPHTDQQKQHHEITTQTLQMFLAGQDISDKITQSGIARRSLG